MSVSSSATSAQETIKDILEGYTGWTLESPNVFYVQEVAEAERGPGDGQPAEMYIWEPTGASLDAFDASYSHIDETRTVEIWVFTLEDGDIGVDNEQYQQDVIDLMSEYANDNESNTNFHRIRPTNAEDRRNEHQTRDSGHHVCAVEITMRNFRDSGV